MTDDKYTEREVRAMMQSTGCTEDEALARIKRATLAVATDTMAWIREDRKRKRKVAS